MTTDNKIVNTIAKVVEITGRLNINYLIFGSCGIQSYLKYFFRLPNDIDIVLKEIDTQSFLNYCSESGNRVVNEQGRYKVYINNFPVHVIPEIFSIINKEDSTIFTKVNFMEAFNRPSINKFNFLYNESEFSANVMPLDYSIFMELVRKQDTNSFYSLVALLSIPNLPIKGILALFLRYPELEQRVYAAMELFEERICFEEIYFYPDLTNCKIQLNSLKMYFNKLSTN